MMAEVYANSVCNIAAMGAVDGRDEFIFNRDSSKILTFKLIVKVYVSRSMHRSARIDKPHLQNGRQYTFSWADRWEYGVEKAPLNHRCWVIQERVLVIIQAFLNNPDATG